MEKYITIPSPYAGRPNYVLPVSNILTIAMTSENQIKITFCNKAEDVFISISNPTAIATGTTTTFTTGNILIDSSATFVTSGVKPGDYVKAASANISKVVSVDSETQLTLASFIFTDKVAQNYSIFVDIDTPVKFLQDAMLEALQSEWIDPVYEITEVPFTITDITN